MNNEYLDREWGELRHAYGTAENVPGLLSDLNSSDPAARNKAVRELFGTIWHQGTVYPATVKAIPHLVAMLRTPDCVDREAVAVLLASIADGEGYYSVHGNDEKLGPTFETILMERGSSLAKEVAHEKDYLRAIREMAIGFMPLIEDYLDSPNAIARELIVSAVIRYAPHFPQYESLLVARIQSETDDEVRDVIASGLARLREQRAR